MRGNAFERRLSRAEVAAKAICGPWEPSPERQAELHRHFDAMTANEQAELLQILDKSRAGTLTEEDGARFSELWSKADR